MQLSAEGIKNEILEKNKNILDQYPGLSIYIFGAARLGRNCAFCCKKKGIQVLGFLDNRESIQGDVIDGITVYSLQDYLDTGAEKPIVIASLTYWDAIDRQLSDNGITSFLHYSILSVWDLPNFPNSNVCFDGIIDETVGNFDKYIKTRDMLSDHRSRMIFDELIKFRLSLDINFARNAFSLSQPEIYEQYFDLEIISFLADEIFVDGGAYKGETSETFIKHLTQQGKCYAEIYLVEPDSGLLETAKRELSQYPGITYCAAGLSDTCEMSRFAGTGDPGGVINPDGKTEISLETIDKITKSKASFIKLDIEGYENPAILGASETIRNCRPKMAICAYHKSGDMWKLCNTVTEIREDYKVYLRHYTAGAFETVLYFV